MLKRFCPWNFFALPQGSTVLRVWQSHFSERVIFKMIILNLTMRRTHGTLAVAAATTSSSYGRRIVATRTPWGRGTIFIAPNMSSHCDLAMQLLCGCGPGGLHFGPMNLVIWVSSPKPDFITWMKVPPCYHKIGPSLYALIHERLWTLRCIPNMYCALKCREAPKIWRPSINFVINCCQLFRASIH